MTKATIPKPHSIELHSGAYFDFDDPEAMVDVVCVDDIAHHLAICNRFTGATHYPYSVAQHAVFVSKRLERLHYPIEVQFAGLHHDDAEYVMNDTAKPMKLAFAPEEREELESLIDAVIQRALGFEYREWAWKSIIKAADTYAVLVEAHNLLPSKGSGWKEAEAQKQWLLAGASDVPKRIETPDYFRGEITWRMARDGFLARHYDLRERMNSGT